MPFERVFSRLRPGIQVLGAPEPGGWPELREHHRDLLLHRRSWLRRARPARPPVASSSHQAEQDVLGADVVVAQAQGLPKGASASLPRPGRTAPLGECPRGRPAGRQGPGRPRRELPSGDPLRGDGLRGEPLRLGRAARQPGARCRSGRSAARGPVLGRGEHVTGARGEAAEVAEARGPIAGPLGTKRCCAACLDTPMRAPIWLHDAPDPRAWSTKWPMRASDCSSSRADTATASPRCSSAPPSGCSTLT